MVAGWSDGNKGGAAVVTQTDTFKGGEVDRRRFLKRAGTVAWLTPVILTLSTKAAYANHCKGNGSTCGNFKDGVCVPQGTLCCTQCSCTPDPDDSKKCKCTGTCPQVPS